MLSYRDLILLFQDNAGLRCSSDDFNFRSRKLDPFSIIFCIVIYMANNGPYFADKRIDSIYQVFLMFRRDKDFYADANEPADKQVTLAAFHKRLDDKNVLKLVQQILQYFIALMPSSPFYDDCKMVEHIRSCMNQEDLAVFLVDGTEFNVPDRSANEFNCESRNGCGLKLHACLAPDKGVFTNLSITQGVDSERAFVLNSDFGNNCLLIMDRGYSGWAIMTYCMAKGNYFLIRGKADTQGIIIDARDGTGNCIEELINQPLQKALDPKFNRYVFIDMKVRVNNPQKATSSEFDPNSIEIKVVRKYDEYDEGEGKAKTGKINLFVTNITSEQMSMEDIAKTYRFRWNIETAFKDLKSFCGFNTINSGKLNKILLFRYCSLIAFTLKQLFASVALQAAYKQSGDDTDTCFNLSKQKFFSYPNIAKLCNDLLRKCLIGKKSSVCECIKKLRKELHDIAGKGKERITKIVQSVVT